jgi:tRNA (guanine37-N1)-methyltransferase
MRIDLFTLFPAFFDSPLKTAIFHRANQKGLASFYVHNIRDYTHDKHHITDDYPYGGGAGMLMKPEPIFEAVESVMGQDIREQARVPVVLLTPQGRLFSQREAGRLSRYERIAFICGHYEGIDERVRTELVTDEISIGDYVLTGGELPALVVADAVVRLVPGVLGSAESITEESHAGGLLEYPQYTRPSDHRGISVPEVLLSGDHGAVARWRRKESLRRTLERRPELLKDARLSPDDKRFINEIYAESLEKKGRPDH